LWAALRGKKVRGLRFRCQHAVGPYILDFYCPSLKLAVEVDCAAHIGSEAQDESRTEHLRAYGVHVLRFTNAQVLVQLNDVTAQIKETAAPLEKAASQE
jgi:very-short-patch-repair endonuclease